MSGAASGWRPLRYAQFRRWWLANLTSNVGSWMQTVAAQWLMTSLTGSAVLVGAIQATNLPVLALAIPAGVLGDLFNRKRLILGGQVVMLAAAALLGLLDARGDVTPAVLLILLCGVGVGQGLTGPIAQTLQPELVPISDRPQAIALGAVNQNLARSIGPAIGGLLLAATSAALVFLINAASFLVVLVAVALATVPPRVFNLPREHVRSAARVGSRYVRNSPALLALTARGASFGFFATGVWALLPLVARHTLRLGSGGYGLLLACVGIGALIGATYSPMIRRSITTRTLMAGCAGIMALATLALAFSHSAVLDGAMLVLTGTTWILALGLLGASYQSALPSWVKARAMAYYTVAFQGSTAIGALALGTVAQTTSLKTALIVVAAGLIAGAGATIRLSLPKPGDIDVTPASPIPLDTDHDGATGAVLVTVTYNVRPDSLDQFLAQADALQRIRKRTGAAEWRMWHHTAVPGRLVETFVVGSWDEHERQHARLTRQDEALLGALDSLLVSDSPRVAHHYDAAPRGPKYPSSAAPWRL
ncbi:MAG TPA: MFS transporter [Solirubrobacteraceae bacterium]|nr:MFS transporter [Solirubrobacteraceae bacterium]